MEHINSIENFVFFVENKLPATKSEQFCKKKLQKTIYQVF